MRVGVALREATTQIHTHAIECFGLHKRRWAQWGWESDDPRKLFAEASLMLSYATFFALLTRAFVLLGMIEFFGSKGRQ